MLYNMPNSNEPCSFYDQSLIDLDRTIHNWEPQTPDARLVKSAFSSLVSALRLQERERFVRITNQI